MVVVVLVAAAALLANLFTGGEPTDPTTPSVAFKTTAAAFADTGSVKRAKRVDRARVNEAQRAIRLVLDTWYQRTFVDPDVFRAAPEAFPPADALELVAEDARADVAGDVDVLTLGSLRQSFARLSPDAARATITILFQDARRPVMAVADVTFRATATLADPEGEPVRIVHTAALHLQPAGETWQIVYYRADQTQKSIPREAEEP